MNFSVEKMQREHLDSARKMLAEIGNERDPLKIAGLARETLMRVERSGNNLMALYPEARTQEEAEQLFDAQVAGNFKRVLAAPKSHVADLREARAATTQANGTVAGQAPGC